MTEFDSRNLIIRQIAHPYPRPFYIVRRADRNKQFFYILITPLRDKHGNYFYYFWKETEQMVFFEGVPFASYRLSECIHRGWNMADDIIQNQVKITWKNA